MPFYIFLLLVIGEFPGNFSQFFHLVQLIRYGVLYHSTKISFISWGLFAIFGAPRLLHFKALGFSPRFTQHDAPAYTA